MNKVLLEKLRKIIKNVSCNSLKCVYQHQLEEWLEIDSDECSKFIRELVEENFIVVQLSRQKSKLFIMN